MIFNDFQKDTLYSTIIDCGSDLAEKIGKDKRAEDIVLFYDMIQNVTSIQLTEMIIDKLKEKGYEIKKIS